MSGGDMSPALRTMGPVPGVWPINVPVRDWPASHSLTRPDAPAVSCVDTGESRTWSELDQRVGALARGLRDELGVRPGDRVGLLAENDVRTFELQFACVRIGAIFAPLNLRLGLDELRGILADCEPGLLIHDDEHAQTAGELAAGAVPALLGWGAPSAHSAYEQLVARSPFLAGGLLDPEAITQITYTSGTTGLPKGVTASNRTVLFHALNTATACRMAEPNGHHLNVIPLFWAGGLNTYTSPMLYWGGHVTTTRRFDESLTLQLLSDPDRAVTHFCATPEIYIRMAGLPEFAAASFPTVKRAMSGGWRPDTNTMHAVWRERGVFIQLAYGSSETGPHLTIQQIEDPELVESRSCGTPVAFAVIRIVDPTGNDVPQGDIGEIWVTGPAITPGYWNRDPSESFHEGWFRTGDLGRLGTGGDLYIVDRLKEVIRSGGTNVHPAEIERVLIEHPSVADVAVIAVPDQQFGEVGLAVIVLAAGQTVTIEELDEFSRARLARYKRARHLVFVDALPRTASDKIERGTLRKRYAEMFADGARPTT
jgi:fatty-acyl-CoA synthase